MTDSNSNGYPANLVTVQAPFQPQIVSEQPGEQKSPPEEEQKPEEEKPSFTREEKCCMFALCCELCMDWAGILVSCCDRHL